MYDLDHLLNGKGSRQHHQDMIRQAREIRLSREVKTAQASRKITAPLRTGFNVIIKWVVNGV